MSDKIFQVCNVCGATNSTNSTSWVRIFGVTMGAASQPMMNVTPPPPGQPRQFMPPPKLDFCPACAVKTTVDALPTILMKARPSQLVTAK